MMWMAPFGDGTGGKPLGVCCLAQGDLIGQACGQVIPFLNDGAPGGPDGRLGTEGQEILKRLQVFPVQDVIAAALHGVWIGGPLGIDVEHQETVITVCQGDALYGFERIVQPVRMAVEGLMPMQMRGFFPRVPNMYRYSL